MRAIAGAAVPVVTNGTAVALMLLEGEISIEAVDSRGAPLPPLAVSSIATVLFPAMGVPERIRVERDAKWLRIRLTDRFEHAIA